MSDVAMPASVVRQHLRSAIDLVIYVERSSSGSRVVRDIMRVGETAEADVAVVSNGALKP